jgi:hypothetical protein
MTVRTNEELMALPIDTAIEVFWEHSASGGVDAGGQLLYERILAEKFNGVYADFQVWWEANKPQQSDC